MTNDNNCAAEMRIRLALATSALTRLNKIWKSPIAFATKFRLYKSLVVSTLLYGCETWTLLADSERRITAFENKSFRKLLRISYKDHATNDFVRTLVEGYVGPQEPLLATVRRRKLKWFGHVSRHDTLSKTILQGTVEGGRRRGRQRKSWLDNIKDWTNLGVPELLARLADRSAWRETAASSALRSPRRLAKSRD